MHEILQSLSEPALINAIEGNTHAFLRLGGEWSGADVYVGPDLQWLITGMDVHLFNVFCRARLTPDATDTTIRKAKHLARSRNVSISWRIDPSTKPTDLGAYLERYGFTLAWEEPCMAADLLTLNETLPSPAGLVIERVGDAKTLERFCHIAVVGSGFPASTEGTCLEMLSSIALDPEIQFHNYIGWLNEEAVATSSLYLEAGVAGIYWVATVPEARRQGIGTAMTLAPLRDAREVGYRVGILGASDMGYGVYQQIGFREFFRSDYYVWSFEPD